MKDILSQEETSPLNNEILDRSLKEQRMHTAFPQKERKRLTCA